jgi:drug/metabolite transporter (DMT)-like permease
VKERTAAYLYLHSAVLLFGFTAILGDLIQLPQMAIVWYRTLLAVLSLLLFPGMIRRLLALPRRTVFSLMGIGVLVALHWAFFFGAIQVINASITIVCLATGGLFTAILEPVMLRTKVKVHQVLLGILVIPGVWLVVEGGEKLDNLALGVTMALISALFASIFGILNKPMVAHYDPVSITFVEMASGWALMSLLLPFWYYRNPADAFLPRWQDWIFLAALAILCTTYAYQATLKALKALSPFSVSLTINLEPVYTVLLAIPILHEHRELTWTFYLGAGIILLSVFLHPVIERFLKPPITEE